MKKLLIAILAIAVIVALYFVFKTNDESWTTYNGSRFSFQYPQKYILNETSDELTITSIRIPKVDEDECQKLDDDQARSYCLHPESLLSPNIKIKIIPGNAESIWENEKIWFEEQTKEKINGLEYNIDHYAGEFGGTKMYGLFLDDGLLLAEFNHEDSEGGFIFEQTNEYQLDWHQQDELLQNILGTLVLK